MKIIFFSSKSYDEEYFTIANQQHKHELRFVEPRLTIDTTGLIKDEQVACVFVNDVVDQEVISALAKSDIKLIALRCAGYDNVDLAAAKAFDISVVRVPDYSPYAVAEHTFCLILALNRKVHKAYTRVRDGNFSLVGLLGFDLHGKTLGIIGTGKIGSIVASTANAMGMRVLAYDPYIEPTHKQNYIEYMPIESLYSEADIISLHCPLTPQTHHMIDEQALAAMKQGVMLINTSRGALLDTNAIIKGLKTKQIGYLGLDVYEQEKGLFFEDFSGEIIQDDVFERLLTFPNVLITSHQGFFTVDALNNIAESILESIDLFAENKPLPNEVV